MFSVCKLQLKRLKTIVYIFVVYVRKRQELRFAP